MVKKLFLFLAVMLFYCASCEKELHKLSMAKTPYTGNELRIDGYYYSNQVFTDYNGIVVFYRDGICMNVYGRFENQNTLRYIENEILLNEALMSNFRNTPNHIGVFQIKTQSIEFETWEAGRDIITFSHYGEILNDTTFLITKKVNNDSGKSQTLNLTYRFRQFSPKPDSTNTFIK